MNKNYRIVKSKNSSFRIKSFFKNNYYGFDQSMCYYICKNISITPFIPLEFVFLQNKAELDKRVHGLLNKKYLYGLSLKRYVINRISFFETMGNLRGWRLKYRLPVNGQNTKSNAKTARKRK